MKSITFEDLQRDYNQIPMPEGAPIANLWLKKGEHTTQVELLQVDSSGGDPTPLITGACLVVTGGDEAAKGLQKTYLLDVMCVDSPTNFVTDDNGDADWYVVHSAPSIEKAPDGVTVNFSASMGPSREHPTKVATSGSYFPIEYAFPTMAVKSIADPALVVSAVAEKDASLSRSGAATNAQVAEGLLHMQLQAAGIAPSASDSRSILGDLIQWLGDEIVCPGAIVVQHGACKMLAAHYPNGMTLERRCQGLDYEEVKVTQVPPETGNSTFDAFLIHESLNRHMHLRYRLKARLMP